MRTNILSLILAALLLGACASQEAQQTVEEDSTRTAPAVDSSWIAGTVTYRERIALPPDAVVHIKLVEMNAGQDILAETSITEPGQVPIPFTLAYDPGRIDPDRRYALDVTIVDNEEQVLWVTPEPVPALSYGAPATLDILVHQFGPAQTVWEAARQRGVAFRALGNEPGWVVELYDDPLRIELSVDYGQTTYTFTDIEREGESASSTTYRARTSEHTLEIVLGDQTCQDTMSGETFETTVTVHLDDRTLQGCGRSLR